jgi:molybdopterin synthase catalytic subunit
VAVQEGPLPVGEALTWVVRPDCGAVASFFGTVRDHSEGRSGVTALEYETYPEQVEARLRQVAAALRERWPEAGRVVLLHRIGRLEVSEISVLVAVSTPHRAEAFEAARFGIDTVKESVPIWKREFWAGGSDWAECNHELIDLDGRADHP